MTRNFGFPSATRRPASGDQPLAASHHDADKTRVVSNSVAVASTPLASWPNSEGSNLPLFIPVKSPLERGQFAQALIDVITVVFGIIFVCSLACSVPLAIFLMLIAEF